MAMSRQRKRFTPPTLEQRMKALGETDNVSIHLFFKSKENYLCFHENFLAE
jgi:hypothetical protein